MTRATRPGSVQDAVGRAIRAVGGFQGAADDLGVSVSVLSYGTDHREDRPGGLGVNYLDRLGRIDPAAALPIADHFARLAGGVFHPVDLAGEAAADVHRVTAEFSDVLARHAEAHSSASDDPSGYTPHEAGRQVRELDELISAAAAMRALMVRRSGNE